MYFLPFSRTVWRVLALPLSDAVWVLPGLSALTRDVCAFLPLSVALSCLATVFFCSVLGFAAGFAVLAIAFFSAAALAAGLAFSLLFSAVLVAGLTFSLLFSAALAGLTAVFLLVLTAGLPDYKIGRASCRERV